MVRLERRQRRRRRRRRRWWSSMRPCWWARSLHFEINLPPWRSERARMAPTSSLFVPCGTRGRSGSVWWRVGVGRRSGSGGGLRRQPRPITRPHLRVSCYPGGERLAEARRLPSPRAAAFRSASQKLAIGWSCGRPRAMAIKLIIKSTYSRSSGYRNRYTTDRSERVIPCI